jgi:uncharacterized FlgJ-related protein
VAASVAAVVVIVRIAAPVPAIVISPATVAELEAAVDRPGEAIVARLPGDWDETLDAARRRELFIAVVSPLVDMQNDRLRAERAEVEAFIAAERLGEPLSLPAQARRDVLARAYRVRYDDLDELLRRVDVVPVRLAVAQAAHVTGWGTSTAAREANALYGRRPQGEDVDERRFDDLSESVADYIAALNTLPDFADFRAARSAARGQARRPIAEELVAHVAPFASDPAFASSVARMLEGLPPLSNAP